MAASAGRYNIAAVSALGYQEAEFAPLPLSGPLDTESLHQVQCHQIRLAAAFVGLLRTWFFTPVSTREPLAQGSRDLTWKLQHGQSHSRERLGLLLKFSYSHLLEICKVLCGNVFRICYSSFFPFVLGFLHTGPALRLSNCNTLSPTSWKPPYNPSLPCYLFEVEIWASSPYHT